jgi:GH25 family lysozyme M1 (1,4-beta-N-acetylmuramidase)
MEQPALATVATARRHTRRPWRRVSALAALALAAGLVSTGGDRASAASGSTLPGIDVSHHNGAIDWFKVKGAGIKFAYAKATEGTGFTDPRFFENRAGAEARHIAFGAYHFARPGGSTTAQIAADGKAEADYFLDTVGPRASELLPVLDLENDGSPQQHMTPDQLQDWTWAFLNEVVARIHEKPIIYSGGFWRDHMADTTEFADAGFKLLWVPHWTSDPQPRVPAKDWGGYGWTFWQYASCGSVPGVTGCVDMDRYNGTDLTRVQLGVPPSNAALPGFSGRAEETATLTASNGQWKGTSPLVFTYRWRRCDAGGGSCAYIPGADDRSYTLAAADVGASVAVEVTASNAVGSDAAESDRTPPVDRYDVTPPSVPVFTAPTRYVVSTSVPVAWSSTDDRSGVGAYAVRVRTAPASGRFGPTRDLFPSTTATGADLAAGPGHSYCFTAMATDRWENPSAWSGERCTTVPMDDRQLTASAGWTRERGPEYFRQTALRTTTHGATLSRAGLNAHRIRVVAETCPACGRIRVVWHGRAIGTFDLVTSRTLHRHLLGELVLPAVQAGTLQIRVASQRRPVVIDGVAVTRL